MIEVDSRTINVVFIWTIDWLVDLGMSCLVAVGRILPSFQPTIEGTSVVLEVLECSVADPDPFHFGQPEQKISQNFVKFPQKSTKIIRISYIFFQNIV